MVHLTPISGTGGVTLESAPLAIGLFVSVSALVALCAKHSIRKFGKQSNTSKIAPRSPLSPSPKQLLSNISNKAISYIYKKKIGEESEIADVKADEGFGDGGLWQRAILMGEKCQLPEFSGVIYYDNDGKQLSQLPPRSPRASPLPSFSFLVEKAEK